MNERTILYYCRNPYSLRYVADFDPVLLRLCPVDQARGKDKKRLNELFIMFDTETSKSFPDRKKIVGGAETYVENPNYIVAWSCAISILGHPQVTIWGDHPEQIAPALSMIHEALKGNWTIIYVHNLAYDWQFMRKFLFEAWGEPVAQLNTKPHYPVNIDFANGITLRDSLILSQRSIERWAKDLNAPHQKAVGSWDYDRIRHQGEPLTEDELKYIECDVLAGVECLDILRRQLKCSYTAMPYTQTGIVRTAGRAEGKQDRAHQHAVEYYTNSYEVYQLMEKIYHGGYVHANRHIVGWTIDGGIDAYDFSSSFPFCMLVENMPMGRFSRTSMNITPAYILRNMKSEAFIFKFTCTGLHLKDPDDPFPPLQLYKVERVVDAVVDNGRILDAGYVSIYMNEVDFLTIQRAYNWKRCTITDVWSAVKEPLPRWLRDFVYQLYKDKTQLKGGDPVLYAIRKAMLNSVYGMTVQKLVMDDIMENYGTGDYMVIEKRSEEEYEKAVKNHNTFLFYAWGVWVTSYAMQHVLELTHCVNDRTYNALYVDTDSCYATDWNRQALDQYNKLCAAKLKAAGYKPVEHNGREYIPGVAELDGEYTQFRTVGAKRYCCRKKSGELKLTVSGVPKKRGALCLKDDIENFRRGFNFKGEETGKLTHLYQYVEAPYRNEYGDLIADSVNLVPCDYLLDESIQHAVESFGREEIYIDFFDEEELL